MHEPHQVTVCLLQDSHRGCCAKTGHGQGQHGHQQRPKDNRGGCGRGQAHIGSGRGGERTNCGAERVSEEQRPHAIVRRTRELIPAIGSAERERESSHTDG